MTTTTACTCAPQSLRSQTAVPLRSPQTSITLAEAARQRRRERRQRRQGRARRAAWFARFDRRPFDLVCTRATPGIVFFGTAPLVYSLALF
jgi:hypothetical protein